MKHKLLIVLITSFCSVTSFAQVSDTTIFTFADFYEIVINNHPLAKQAKLLSQQGAQEVRLARGNFDPKIGFSWDRKDFKDTEYYNIINANLKIPTWFGLTPEVGIDQNTGEYLNPESYISPSTDNQQLFAGLSASIGKGLFIDQRRATLQQAKLFSQMMEAEQIKELNKLLLTAAKDYWEWYFAYNNYRVLQQNVVLAEDIFKRTKLGFTYGEVAMIDTIQAKTNLLTRKSELITADIERNKASLKLATHLWDENRNPLELRENARPEDIIISEISEKLLTELVEAARQNHPELIKLRLKNESLGIERRLAIENLKPQLDVKYLMLDQPFSPDFNSTGISLTDNYKYGIDFSIPLFLRKERAKIKQTELKIIDNNFEQDYQERVIINTINGSYIELINTSIISIQQTEMVRNYQLIVDAERLNLSNGESDLFKLNIQLDKFLESQSKLIKTLSTYQKNLAELYWISGVTNLGLD